MLKNKEQRQTLSVGRLKPLSKKNSFHNSSQYTQD